MLSKWKNIYQSIDVQVRVELYQQATKKNFYNEEVFWTFFVRLENIMFLSWM